MKNMINFQQIEKELISKFAPVQEWLEAEKTEIICVRGTYNRNGSANIESVTAGLRPKQGVFFSVDVDIEIPTYSDFTAEDEIKKFLTAQHSGVEIWVRID